MAAWDLNSIRFQLLKEVGANASRSEATMDAVLIGTLFNEPIDFLHLDNFSFHTGNFADARYHAASIGKSLQLDDKLLLLMRLYFECCLDSFRCPAIATICSSRFIASRGVFA